MVNFGWPLRLAGSFAIVIVFFFGTLFLLDRMDSTAPTDAIRIKNANQIIVALEKYRTEKGAYPVLRVPDSPIQELKGPLVDGGYLKSIPVDPPDKRPTRYVSYDGKSFGLGLHQTSGPCMVEINASKTGWWGQLPACKL